MGEKELKPCPLCKGKAIFRTVECVKPKTNSASIICEECGAKVRSKRKGASLQHNMNIVIEKWETRDSEIKEKAILKMVGALKECNYAMFNNDTLVKSMAQKIAQEALLEVNNGE